MKRWLIPCALVFAGCTSFDSVPSGTCGNGLLEPGEDCDSPDASCVRCAVLCTQGGSAMQCPTSDYACGVDGFCHAPGGALAQSVIAGAFQADELTVTDLDHDGIGDVLGISKTSMVIRHGESTGALQTLDSILTPQQIGPAAFGDLDLDKSADVTIATPDGLVTYTAPFGRLTPFAVASPIKGMNNEPLDIRMLFHLGATVFGGFVSDGTHVFVLAVDLQDPTQATFGPPCVARNGLLALADFSAANIDVYQVNRNSDAVIDTVVAMSTGAGANAKLCVLSIHRNAPTLLVPVPVAQVLDITPTNAAPLANKPILADLDTDSDRCPGVINSDGGVAGYRQWDGAMNSGHCTLASSASVTGDPLPPLMAPPSSTLVGRVSLDPMIILVGSDALVLSDGVYGYVPLTNSFTQALYHSNRKLAGAAIGDVNGDGLIDAVVFPDGQDDVDVLLRAPLGYQLLRLDTASEVTTVTIDDFDGNGIGDIAYTERIASHQRLMIAYGTQDYPLAPVETGAFAEVISVVRFEIRDSVDILAQAADLAILQTSSNGPALALTLLHGSPQRTMLAYFDPRLAADRSTTQFHGAVIGQFGSASGETKPYRDVVAIAPPAGLVSSTKVKGWLVKGTADGLDGTESSGVNVNGFADCTGSAANPGVCIQDPSYLAWPVSPTKDVVVVVDRQTTPHAAVVDPWSSSGDLTASPASALTAAAPPQTVIRSLHAADIDGDGALDLVATFAPASNAAGASAVLVCSATNGIPQACKNVLPAIMAAQPMTSVCLDAAAGHVAYRDPTVTPSPSSDLLVACRDDGSTLYRVYFEAGDYHAIALAHTSLLLTTVRVGDVTGDGVDDVVALEGDKGSQSLVVYRQCSSRDAATCQRTTPVGSGAP